MATARPTAPDTLPRMLTVSEVADKFRTSKKAVYAMIERGQLPGVVRPLARRVLVREDALIDFIRQKSQVVISKG